MNRGHCCDRSGVCVWLLAMLSVLAPIDVLAANRVALVVGNSGYEDAPLRNPSRDADDISSVLKQLGFQVATHKDVTKQQFEDAVDTVTRGLGGGDVCLIFYAGHGMQLDEENYLVPVGAKVDEPQHVEQRCVKVNYLLSALKYSDCSLKIVVVIGMPATIIGCLLLTTLRARHQESGGCAGAAIASTRALFAGQLGG